MTAKDLLIKPITSKEAAAVIRRLHYSGKIVNNSQIHMGVFYAGKLEGALQFGPSLDKRKIQGLVEGTPWNGFLELNRMAFSDALPKNSESRAIAVAMKLLKKHAPTVKWVISFADASQCGDGTIYRASGFQLTAIKPNSEIARLPDGQVIHSMTLQSNPLSPRPELGGRSFYDVTGGKYDWKAYVRATNAEVVPGFQLRYIYFIDKSAATRLTVPTLPFSAIDEYGARMYLGSRPESIVSDAASFQEAEGSATLTSGLHLPNVGVTT